VDAVLPRRAWTRPLAYAIRRLDRGRFVRNEAEHIDLLNTALPSYKKIRVNSTDTGLEAIWAWAKTA
jgi:hypothetical protein